MWVKARRAIADDEDARVARREAKVWEEVWL